MNTRFTAASLLLTAVVSAPVSASVLSASNAAGKVRSDRVDYLKVTEVQNDMNASLTERADATTPGSFAGVAPAVAPSDGGFIVQSAGATTTIGSGSSSLFDRNRPGFSNSRNDNRNNRGNNRERDRDRGRNNRNRDRDRDRNDRRGGGAHATPEPSTWMLLGTGVLMLGIYARMRRQQENSI